jgi:hypothetical protein
MSHQPITLTAYEFWNYVKDDTDCDEILERLGGHNELISHFLYFSSLSHTLDDLNNFVKKKKKEIGHVYTELTQSPKFRRLIAPLVRRKHRHHPYQRPPVVSRPSPRNNTSLGNESPQTIPILSLPPSPILLGDSPLTPIDVDSLSSSSSIPSTYTTVPMHPPTRPTTPKPSFGTAHRIYHDDIQYFIQDGVYYVREELSGHIYTEEEFYNLPRPSYRHHLPQLRLPSIPRTPRRN